MIFTKIPLRVILFSALLGFIFSLGFYIDSRKLTVNNLSSDQWNILPVCIKLDHPELFKGDLFADNNDDIEYYIPFFIDSVRFFTRFSYDNYIEGLNKLNFLINLFFTFFWALFLWLICKNLPLALMMTLIVRGVLWLPGYELWGTGALWTALPRTAFLALIPFALIFFLPENNKSNLRYIGALLCGVISNFHPVSGFSVCVSLIITEFIYQIFINRKCFKYVIIHTFIIAIFISIGLFPYILTYLNKVLTNKPSDPQLYNAFLTFRIGEMFRNPFIALSKFKQIKWTLFILIPFSLLIFIFKKFTEQIKHTGYFYVVFLIVILLTSLIVVPAERFINNVGNEIHMSFQLIRGIKYIMIPVFIFIILEIYFIIEYIKNKYMLNISIVLLITFILILQLARFKPLRELPLIGDDFIRLSLPNLYSLKKEIYSEDIELDGVFDWINKNTEKNAMFVGPPQLRAACRRSVIFDGKGASMLIEGNPDKFILWGKRAIALKECMNNSCKLELYKKWGAEYLLIDEVIEEKMPEFTNGKWNLYKL